MKNTIIQLTGYITIYECDSRALAVCLRKTNKTLRGNIVLVSQRGFKVFVLYVTVKNTY